MSAERFEQYGIAMKGRIWTEAELVRALALYYQIPFGSIDQRNLAIIALAEELGRTPGSVGVQVRTHFNIIVNAYS